MVPMWKNHLWPCEYEYDKAQPLRHSISYTGYVGLKHHAFGAQILQDKPRKHLLCGAIWLDNAYPSFHPACCFGDHWTGQSIVQLPNLKADHRSQSTSHMSTTAFLQFLHLILWADHSVSHSADVLSASPGGTSSLTQLRLTLLNIQAHGGFS